CGSTLERCTEVGIVSGWARRSKYDKSVVIRPCPGFPYQWLANEAAPFSAVRTEALLEAGSFRPAMAHGYDDWDLFNAVMAAGWVAVTVPEVLAYHRYRNDTAPHITNLNGNARARRELLERFPDLLARDAKEIVLFVESASARSLAASEFPLRERLARARAILRYPRGPVLRVLRVLKDRIFR
ncbi:MAG TPA: hypothetical protein VFQ92_01690, partial [Blastocatellia bacterium]|nr:hypothetical protein [Blastocatellia bacterium]